MNENSFSTLKKVLLFIVLAPIFVFGFGLVVMLLWNNLLPEIIGVKTITFWQAIGILLLSEILFGGFGNGGKGKSNFGGKQNHEWKQKWRGMSDEERDKFREQWKKRCRPDSE